LKILLYSANFAPEPTGIGKYSGEMAAWLVSQGHEVRVVAAPPFYPSWKLGEGYAWPPYRREQWQGVDVWRAPLWVPRKPNGITRLLHLLTFALTSLPVMLWQVLWRPDVVMTVAPALVCAPTGWLVAKLSGGKSWLHIQDFEVDVAFQMGLLKGKFLKSLVLGAERQLLSLFDVVSSISGSMLSKLRSKGVAEERIRFFPNWVDIAHICPLSEPSHYRKELGIEPNAKVVLFSGSLGNKQGLMVIPEAARQLTHREDIVFVVCGDGVTKPQLENACSGLANVSFIPLQPFENLGQLLGLADIHLLPQSPEAADLVLPSKLSGMLASGVPIIATCRNDTEIASVVSKCGLIVPPENGTELAYAIENLVDNFDDRLKFGAQARIYSEENLARDSVLGRLLKQFTEVVIEPRTEWIDSKHIVNQLRSMFIVIFKNSWWLQKTQSIGPASSNVIALSDHSGAHTSVTATMSTSLRDHSKIATEMSNSEVMSPMNNIFVMVTSTQKMDNDVAYQIQSQSGIGSRLNLEEIISHDLVPEKQVISYQ
jgi:colanic acid biosynthesis glycosyl transferase WcaI